MLTGAPSRPTSASRWSTGRINYIPAPGTAYRILRKLLHDQTLHMPTRSPAPPVGIAPLPPSGGADVLAAELIRFAASCARAGRADLPAADRRARFAHPAAAFVAAGVVDGDARLRRQAAQRRHGRPPSAGGWGSHHRIALQGDPAAADQLWHHTAGACLDWDNTHIFPGAGYRYSGPDDE